MVTVALKQMFARPDHALWVLVQQFAVRGMIALKFLLAAHLLGPDQIGLVGIATLSLAIVESLSDTGLSQAVVQSRSKISRQEAGAVWTLQLTRGVVLAVMLFVLAVPFSLLFKVPTSSSLIALAAIMPLLRNAFNPGIFLVQRDRNFRQLSIYEASAALLDLAITLLLIHLGFGPASILLGNIASDSLKLVLTWTWCRTPVTPNFQWRLIKSLTSFGKWIWGSSVITLVLNQLDKVLVARFLGVTEFGLYQVASRIAQLVIADGAVALGQYLYPTFAQRHRASSQGAREYLGWILRRWVLLAATVAALLVLVSGFLVSVVLGSEWTAAVPLLRVMAAPMFLGAVIAILVAYLRGTGKPRVVTEATLIQLIVLIACAPILLHYFEAIGMASSLAVAGTASAAFMFFRIFKR
jgi:PST family polysaccharide transporter